MDNLGLYSPHEIFWRINREWLIAYSGSRALLLEVAHPLVAAGVAQYSRFRTHPLDRLMRTMRTMTRMTFGSAGEARASAGDYFSAHQRVRGVLPEGEGGLPAGTPFSGSDPNLRLWVYATLIDSVLLVYDLFVRPIDDEERAAYYVQSKRLAHRLGIPQAVMPEDYPAFARYMDTMIHGGSLCAGPTARAIVDSLFGPTIVGRLALQGSFAGIGLLPPHLREAFGFGWGEKEAARLRRMAARARAIRPLLPDFLCVHPRATVGAIRRWLATRAG